MENKIVFLLEQILEELKDLKDTIENLEFEIEEEEEGEDLFYGWEE